jgi:hypothetical protein
MWVKKASKPVVAAMMDRPMAGTVSACGLCAIPVRARLDSLIDFAWWQARGVCVGAGCRLGGRYWGQHVNERVLPTLSGGKHEYLRMTRPSNSLRAPGGVINSQMPEWMSVGGNFLQSEILGIILLRGRTAEACASCTRRKREPNCGDIGLKSGNSLID